MSCIEIFYNNRRFRLTNETEEQIKKSKSKKNKSDAVSATASDYTLLINFLSTKKLENGFSFFEIDKNGKKIQYEDTTSILDIFKNLKDDIENTSEQLQPKQLFNNLLANKITYEEFVNKIIGNYSISFDNQNELMIVKDGFDHNIVQLPSLGNTKTWFGFTDKRMIIVTGQSIDNIKEDRSILNLINLYNLLRSNNKYTENLIRKLYEKYSDNLITKNKYEQLMWLANNQLNDLYLQTWIPNNQLFATKKEIKQLLKVNKSDNLKNKYFEYNNNFYIIESIKENIVTAFNINKNQKENLLIDKLSVLFNLIHIESNKKNYVLIKKQLYEVTNNGKYRLISPQENINNKSYDNFLQDCFCFNSNDDYIDVARLKLKIQNNDENIQRIINQLPEETKIKTSSGLFIKNNNEQFISTTDNTIELQSTENIKAIYLPKTTNSKLEENIKSLLIENPEKQYLSSNDIRALFYDVFSKYNNQNNEPQNIITFGFQNLKDKNKILKIYRIKNEKDIMTNNLKVNFNFQIELNQDNVQQLYWIFSFINKFQTLTDNDTKNYILEKIETIWDKFLKYAINTTFETKNVDENIKNKVKEFFTEIIKDSENKYHNKEHDIVQHIQKELKETISALNNENNAMNYDEYLQMLIDKGIGKIYCEL